MITIQNDGKITSRATVNRGNVDIEEIKKQAVKEAFEKLREKTTKQTILICAGTPTETVYKITEKEFNVIMKECMKG